MFENFIWYKIIAEIKFKRLSPSMRSHYIATINAVIKEINENFNETLKEKIFFHIKNFTISNKIGINKPFLLEIIIPTDNYNLATEWYNLFLLYFNTPENIRNIALVETFPPEKRNYNILKNELRIKNILDKVALYFYTPFNFRKHIQHSKTFLKKEVFISFIKKRIKRLFNVDVKEIDNLEFDLLSYFWKYVQFKHTSKSQYGHIQYINGCIGYLVIKGDIDKLIPYLLLLSELHLTEKNSYSYGYYKITNTNFLDYELSSNKESYFIEQYFYKPISTLLQNSFKKQILNFTDENIIDNLELLAIDGYCYYLYLTHSNIIEKINKNYLIELIEKYFFKENNKVKNYIIDLFTKKNKKVIAKIVELTLFENIKDFDNLEIAIYKSGYLIFAKHFTILKDISFKASVVSVFEENLINGKKIQIKTDFPSNIIENSKNLYILTPFVTLRKYYNNLLLERDNAKFFQCPIKMLSGIIITSDTKITTPLINQCIQDNVPISISLKNKKNYSVTINRQDKNYYFLLSKHWNKFFSLSEEEHLKICKNLIEAKFANYETFLLKRKVKPANEICKNIKSIKTKLNKAKNIDEIFGFEGIVSTEIFKFYRSIILQKDFIFEKREPFSNDFFNKLLNSAYRQLSQEINLLLRANGLNPYLGFLHNFNNNYESLVYDIMELFRVIVDRMVLKLINLKIVTKKDFTIKKGVVKLSYNGLKKVISHYQATFNPYFRDILEKQVTIIKNWIKKDTPVSFITLQ